MNVAWNGDGHLQRLSPAKFVYWRAHAHTLSAMATWRLLPGRADTQGNVPPVRALAVSRDFFEVLGYTPPRGRAFVEAEYASGGAKVAVISHAMWAADFESAADVVGRSVRLNEESLTVVGVLPESFAFPYEDVPVHVIVPLELIVDPDDLAEDWPAIARLREGVTTAHAQSEIASLTEPFRAAYPTQVSAQDQGMTLATFSELYVRDSVRRALWILMGAVTLVLLIACANAANLFLVRAARRRGEIALRVALGATQGRINRLVLTESVVVAMTAGAIGLLLGKWVAGVLIALAPTEIPRMDAAGIDWRVTSFTFAVALATSLLSGSVAVWPASRARLAEVLKEGTRVSSSWNRTRQGLLAAQSALSMVLLVGAGLLLTTLISLMRVDPGFDPVGLVAVKLQSTPARYDTSRDFWELEQRVMQQLEGSPVIASIAGASSLPFERGVNTPMVIGGRPDVGGTVEWRAVTPGYFRTLAIQVLAGRAFESTDVRGDSPVAIVNESFARRYFPGESPIGQHIEIGRRVQGGLIDASLAGPGARIVGVVADIREVSLRTEPRRTIYVTQAQASTYLSRVRGTMPVFIARPLVAGDVSRALTHALRAADPGLPMPEILPFSGIVARSLAQERFAATLLSVLAALALALTAFGIYGVLAYTVQQRRREIGIRMALGAPGHQVTRFVMAQGIAPVLVGLLVGVLGSIGLSRLVASFLWGVTPTDPTTLAIVVAVLLVVALVSSWLPAREAAAVDPVSTLNSE
jgi:predicted permease